jgi:hypothetical protein
MSRRIRLGGVDIDAGDATFDERLGQAFSHREHPLCLCQAEGVAMYIARFGERHILKRMPGTGAQHAPDCESYEPPSELSGLSAVEGEAIVENVDDGTTALKLGFSLSKLAGRPTPSSGNALDSGDVRTDGARLSLKAMLHFLWDRAQFNRWRPAMSGRRNWAVVRKYLIEAASSSSARGKPLSDALYIPEMFDPERADAIVQRRQAFLSRAVQSQGNRRSLAILIGEVKEIQPARSGSRLIIKHAPRYPFMLAEDVARRMNKVFASELALSDASPESHLIAAATFRVGVSGIAAIEAIALMVVNERWIPFESQYEGLLLDTLAKRGSIFMKGLRYNLAATQPMASVVLTLNRTEPVAMYIVPDDADTAYRESLDTLTCESEMASWIWDIATGPMPELPL